MGCGFCGSSIIRIPAEDSQRPAQRSAPPDRAGAGCHWRSDNTISPPSPFKGSVCATPAGELLGKIHIPKPVANLCFGGMFRNRLYICRSTSLDAVYTSAAGAMKP
jgi:sugar lactone lactonase YvrE